MKIGVLSGVVMGAVGLAVLLSACSSTAKKPLLATVPKVDISRFMGNWYVIANIPTFMEKNAYNAIESYELKDDGSIATTFTFHQGSFDGPLKRYHPHGYVVENTNGAIWGMQFLWPIKADYRIMYLADDYSVTIVGRQKRDYVWIMARTPHIPESQYQHLLKLIAEQGYDISQIEKVPQP